MKAQEKVMYGINPVYEALNKGLQIKKVFVEKGKDHPRIQSVLDLCEEKGISCLRKSQRYLDKLAGSNKHQGLVAFFIPKELLYCFEDPNLSPRIRDWFGLFLDGIQDPRNFGAVVRSAEYFSVDQIYYPDKHGAPWNEVAQKTACGAGASLPPYRIKSIPRFLEKMKKEGFHIVGTSDRGAKPLDEFRLQGPTLLIMGSEGEGVCEKTGKFCDEWIRIPGEGNINSLNVSVAAGVILYEMEKQRKALNLSYPH